MLKQDTGATRSVSAEENAAELLRSFLVQTAEALTALSVAKTDALRNGALEDAKRLRTKIADLEQLEGSLMGLVEGSVAAAPSLPQPVAPSPTFSEAPKPPKPVVVPTVAAALVQAPEVKHVAPAREPSNGVVVSPPPPAPKDPAPKKAKQKEGKQLQTLRDRFFDMTRSWEGKDVKNPVLRARVKSIVCVGRALIESSDASIQALAWDELRHLSGSFSANTDLDEFFGWKPGRTHHAELWMEISEAYELLAIAEDCWQWLKTNPDISELDRKSVYDGCAASEAFVYRLFLEKGLGVVDVQQIEFHKALDATSHDFVVHWQADRTLAAISKAAKGLASTVAKLRAAIEARAAKVANSTALSDIQALVSSGHTDERFLEELESKALACLAAGVPPSNKVLVAAVMPYRSMIAERGTEGLARLLEYARREETRILAAKEIVVEEDIPEDPDHEKRLTELRQYLQGKSLLFVGGKKGQSQRAPQFKKELGLKELYWFDSEDGTHLSKLTHDVKRADVVCQLIRWSRHSYKEILDEAKSQGKRIAWIPRGLGFNRVVFDLHQQLVGANGV